MTAVDDRRARALELHLAGATYDAIAKHVGYADRSGAFQAVQAALAAGVEPLDADSVTTELARLDALLTSVWPKARKGDLQAVDRVLKISERRTAVLALAAIEHPVKGASAVDDLAALRAARRTAGPSDTPAESGQRGTRSGRAGGDSGAAS